ncbi:MAG: ATP-binding protein [Actinomycetota bacterium]|nr:ATP-binding protein [Actinomycetota bacterium]
MPDQRRWTRTFRGTPASVPKARRFVAELLAGCPARETLMTCVSELCANAVAHTDSGNGGVFIVEIDCLRDGVARVAVTDEGSDDVPAAGVLDLSAEGGRGLAMVAACTSRWGFAEAYPGRTVWAEASWPVAVPSPGQPPRRRSSPRSGLSGLSGLRSNLRPGLRSARSRRFPPLEAPLEPPLGQIPPAAPSAPADPDGVA